MIQVEKCFKLKRNTDMIGSINDIYVCVYYIGKGRQDLKTIDEEHEERLYYEKGISVTSSVFYGTLFLIDPQTILATEKSFIEQEFIYCNDYDIYFHNSITQVLQSFKNAFQQVQIKQTTLSEWIEIVNLIRKYGKWCIDILYNFVDVDGIMRKLIS